MQRLSKHAQHRNEDRSWCVGSGRRAGEQVVRGEKGTSMLLWQAGEHAVRGEQGGERGERR